MKAAIVLVLLALLGGALFLGYRLASRVQETAVREELEQPDAVAAPAARSPGNRNVRRTGGLQFVEFESLDHKERDETVFARALLYLAESAPVPLVDRVVEEGLAPAAQPPLGVVPEQERQWSGVVLIPTDAVVSRAFTALVNIPHIEAHPQLDRRLRVWARIVNPTGEALRLGVTCSFRSAGELDPYSRGFEPMVLPPGRYRDVAFMSPSANVETYTLLVKRY